MKNALVVMTVLAAFLFLPVLSGKGYAVDCGSSSYEIYSKSACDSANYANGCSIPPSYSTSTNCFTQNGQCVGAYNWTECVPVWDKKEEVGSCKWLSNLVILPCDNYVKPTPGGGGCAPPPAPTDLVVDWGSPFSGQMKAACWA